jgi:branched-chain amino acid transport system permease protein
LELILINLLNGISYASILFLIASGLSLIFGVMGILNLAHGALYMLGAFIGITAATLFDNFPIGAVIGAIGLGIIGLILYYMFLSRLYKQFSEQALLTLGLVYIASNVVTWIWGPWSIMGKVPSILAGSIAIGSRNFPIYRFGLIAIGLVLFGILWWMQDKTRIGARIRAGMDNKDMAMAMGVNYVLLSMGIFIMGAAMGGLAGFLGSPIVGADPGMSMSILLMAMIVVVVGGLGNVQGALLGSLIIGVFDTFGKAYFSDFAMFLVYLIFIIVLMVRPNGLLGRKRV